MKTSKDHPSIAYSKSKSGHEIPVEYEEFDLTGEVLVTPKGEFELLELIKDGREGTVYKARKLHCSEDVVALKVYNRFESAKKYIETNDIYKKVRSLDSPFVKKMMPPLEGFLLERNDKAIVQVSTFAKGGDLSELCFLPEIHDLRSIRILFEQMALGLCDLYRCGIFAHNDIKPENILLEGGSLVNKPDGFKDGSLKIKYIDLERVAMDDVQTRILGTVLFFPPEYKNGEEFPDLKSKDYYALGMSYVMLLLRVSFRHFDLNPYEFDDYFEVTIGNTFEDEDLSTEERIEQIDLMRPWLWEKLDDALQQFKGSDEDRECIDVLIRNLICADYRDRKLVLPDELAIGALFPEYAKRSRFDEIFSVKNLKG